MRSSGLPTIQESTVQSALVVQASRETRISITITRRMATSEERTKLATPFGSRIF